MTKDTNLTAWIRAKNHACDEAMSGTLHSRHTLLHVLADAFAASIYLAGREGKQSHLELAQGMTRWTDRTKRGRESTLNHSTSCCHTEPLWTHFDQRTRYVQSPVLVNLHLSCFHVAKISSWTQTVENYRHISPDFGKTPLKYWNQHAPQYFSL